MKSKAINRWLGVLLLSCTGATVTPQGEFSAIPPGVPEPGLVIWGNLANATNAFQSISIASAVWSVTDGSKTAVYTGVSKPPVQIVTLSGQSYYILEVPFDTRRFGTITLADPAEQGIDSFELKSSSPPTYTLTPTINGVMATVRSIDGASASGGTAPVAGFTTATRGRVIRVDLAIVPPADAYENWAAAHFGSESDPNAARTADPDGDGFSNEWEHGAGTDPNDPASLLRVLTLSVDSSQATLGWMSASNRSYVIEAASDPAGPWTDIGTAVDSAGNTTQASVVRNPADSKIFYRVRIASP